MNKKILFISHMYPTCNDKSYGKVIHEQAMSLIEIGHKIKVICPMPYTPKMLLKYSDKRYLNYYSVPKKDNIDGIDVYYPRYLKLPKNLLMSYSGILMFLGIFKLVGQIKKSFDFDIIHAHFTLPDAYASMKLSKYFNKPLVTTLQASDLDITLNRNKKCKNRIYKALKLSNEVIAPSPRLSNKLINELKLKSNIIGYGININKVKLEPPDTLRTRYHNRIVILSISRLINTKGVDYNIMAISKLKEKYKNIIYLVIGDGPKKESLMELVNELELKEHVEFLGGLDHKSAMEYINISTIFSLPSWQETFGLVYLEAMVNEKPVIGCKGQGFDGIINHFKNGFLANPKDVASIAEIIDFILSNPTITNTVRSKAKKDAIDNFTFNVIADKINYLYNKLL